VKRWLSTVLLLSLACTAQGASTGALAAGEPPRNPTTRPHELRYSTAEDISTLDPVLNQQETLALLSQLTMAYLVRYDRSNRPVPELATVIPTLRNGGISPDGKAITFHLRHGVKWSDGAPFDADDVVFTIHAVLNPKNVITSRDGFDLIRKLDEPDRYTVVLHLSRPYAAFLPTFFGTGGAEPCILPKHILGSLSDINTAPYNSLPVGIGPFRYVAWRRGDAVEMEANPTYWRGLPKLKKIVFKIIPDRNTTLTQLQTGDIDLWWPVSGAFLPRVKSFPGVTYLRQPGYLYNHFDFNLSHAVVADKAVRRALRMAIDRATLRDKVAHGLGILQESIVPQPYPGGPKGIPMVPFDQAKANALLERAGWKRGADGVRAKNGLRLQLEFASSSGSPDVDTQLELIRSWWQQIGVELTVKRYLSSLMFAPASDGGIVLGGKFDVIAFAWQVEALDDLHNVFSCDAIPPKGQNVMHYCNRALEPILADFQRSYDPARQSEDLGKAVRIILEDVPTVVTSSREDVFAYNRDLKNFHPNAVSLFDDMMNVDI
jgi:peptide/nickel transport system substrate-binding protein